MVNIFIYNMLWLLIAQTLKISLFLPNVTYQGETIDKGSFALYLCNIEFNQKETFQNLNLDGRS